MTIISFIMLLHTICNFLCGGSWKWHYEWKYSWCFRKLHTFHFMHELGIVSRYIKLVKVCFKRVILSPPGPKVPTVEEAPFSSVEICGQLSCVDHTFNSVISRPPSVPSPCCFPSMFLHLKPLQTSARHRERHFHLVQIGCDVWAVERYGCHTVALSRCVTVWGGNEGLSEPLAIPLFSLSSPLAWDCCTGDETGARLSSCHCFEAASSLEWVSVGRAKNWALGLKWDSGSSCLDQMGTCFVVVKVYMILYL